MAKYFIKKKAKNKKVVLLEYDSHGYKFNPKNKNSDVFIEVKEVIIYNQKMIDYVLSNKFNKTFKKILAISNYVINDDNASDDAANLCLDEVELVRQILLNKYNHFLSLEKEQLFLKKLNLIENELRIKKMYIKEKMRYLEEMAEYQVGRGR